jgi:RNA polymerase sigma factor (sigma-70 family)
MNRDDYLEDEWPEESPAKPETPAEEEESDWGLYTYDTAPSEEEEDKNAKASPEEADYLNAEDTGFRSIDDHRFFRMIEPPEIKENMNWYEMAGYCIQTYFQTGKRYYYHSFLHYFEPTLNRIAAGFMLRYAMIGHFADLKQEAVLGLLEAEKHYDPAKGTPFLKYGRQYMNNRMHYYIRKMRRGCTVTSAYADKKLRTVMKKFYDYGGRNDLDTICKVAEEMKIPQEEASEIIQCALLNTLCTGTHRQFGSADGEWEESSEERTVSPYPEPYEALLKECQAKALCLAWESLDYREQEMLSSHLGFCPECFGLLEKTGSSEKWYDCIQRKRIPFADLAIDYGLSSPESAQRICEQALKKLQVAIWQNITKELSLC